MPYPLGHEGDIYEARSTGYTQKPGWTIWRVGDKMGNDISFPKSS